MTLYPNPMILSFKSHFGAQPTYFKEKILACIVPGYRILYQPKLHTIRKSSRYRAGQFLHMAYGVRTKKYEQFNRGVTGIEKCTGIQKIEIRWSEAKHESLSPSYTIPFDGRFARIWVDDRPLSFLRAEALATNDGFDSIHDFLNWFSADFQGEIIHWTDLKY